MLKKRFAIELQNWKDNDRKGKVGVATPSKVNNTLRRT
mgnify:CR=1 FL=1